MLNLVHNSQIIVYGMYKITFRHALWLAYLKESFESCLMDTIAYWLWTIERRVSERTGPQSVWVK